MYLCAPAHVTNHLARGWDIQNPDAGEPARAATALQLMTDADSTVFI